MHTQIFVIQYVNIFDDIYFVHASMYMKLLIVIVIAT